MQVSEYTTHGSDGKLKGVRPLCFNDPLKGVKRRFGRESLTGQEPPNVAETSL